MTKLETFLKDQEGNNAHTIYLLSHWLSLFSAHVPIVNGETLKRFRAFIATSYSVATQAQILRAVLQYLHAHDLLTAPFARLLKPPTEEFKGRFLSDDEERALLDACGTPELKRAVMLALETGLRVSEIFASLTAPVTRDDLLFVPGHKGQKDRYVPLSEKAREALDGGPVTCWNAVNSLKKSFYRAVKRSGIKGRLRFHDLRHTCASRMAELGFNPYELKEWFGWSTVQLTDRYTHANLETLRRKTQAADAARRTASVA